jgi:hypothetical protein
VPRYPKKGFLEKILGLSDVGSHEVSGAKQWVGGLRDKGLEFLAGPFCRFPLHEASGGSQDALTYLNVVGGLEVPDLWRWTRPGQRQQPVQAWSAVRGQLMAARPLCG